MRKNTLPSSVVLGGIASFIAIIVFSAMGPFVSAKAQRVDRQHPGAAFPALSSKAFFVATNGNDNNPGTQSAPFRTLRKAGSVATAGYTVYIRGGVYYERLTISNSGTETSPIRFEAYPGETPVIDGQNTIPSSWSGLVYLYGDWTQVSGLEVRNSKYWGVAMRGRHSTAENLYVHHNLDMGIWVGGDYSIAQNNRVWRNALSNENGARLYGSWGTGISAARDVVDGLTQNAIIRNNTVWENWGEGVSTFEASGTLIEGNVVHDSYSTNIYISDATNVTCKRNLVYMTTSSYVYGKGSNVGIMMGDEVYKPASSGIKVIDNLAYGNRRNFYWWQGTKGGGMDNVLIAYNTFVNSTGVANVVIQNGSHQNVRFESNVVQQDSTSVAVAAMTTNTQVVLTNNLWSRATSRPGSAAVIGDAKLSRAGSPSDAAWYKLNNNSPAINKGKVSTDVTQDYFLQPRGTNPDIGGAEYIP